MNTTDIASQVQVSERDSVLKITLNRPAQLNALTAQMCSTITSAIKGCADSHELILFDSSSPKGFCGGGDVKVIAGNDAAATAFLMDEYEKDYWVAKSPVPVVALMGGVTMGGGLGIGAHARYRVVDETSLLAMPETRIGGVPDAGMNEFLARTGNCFGELVAVCSLNFRAGDALAAQLADYYIPSKLHAELRRRLFAGENPQRVCESLSEPAPAAPVFEFAASIDRDFQALAAADPLTRLREFGELLHDADKKTVLDSFASVSVIAAAVALERIYRLREKARSTLEILRSDLLVFRRFVLHRNFVEGVRARLVDKDNKPYFVPGSIADASAAQLAEFLDAPPSIREQEILASWQARFEL
ncbi:enoyl-CoA hydratase/isomerase family protein [Canibacter sp. lx-45]|uniref:enoyl-CoA hydratase/isomerase family protein n=1 Tax=Canibacter zhuwentaonis TaxID=2837491 RepID=UPI001BDD76D2|nr:enoyl-CoA hydratase/isomerase family protein [Canibacter zhuwentaonis]MBT1034757.1 enoyl-CoA hydratase/isomerase family protein [Canibacter zhuwentaonis]